MYTTEDLQRIEKAISSGQLTVQFNGRRVTYKSADELLKIKSTIISQLNGSSSIRSLDATFYDR